MSEPKSSSSPGAPPVPSDGFGFTIALVAEGKCLACRSGAICVDMGKRLGAPPLDARHVAHAYVQGAALMMVSLQSGEDLLFCRSHCKAFQDFIHSAGGIVGSGETSTEAAAVAKALMGLAEGKSS